MIDLLYISHSTDQIVQSLNCLNILYNIRMPRLSYIRQFYMSICMTIRALGFSTFWAFYYVLNLYVSVGGSSVCKLVVFLYVYVGGSDELQPGGPFLHLPPRWLLPADCRRPPLSLS